MPSYFEGLPYALLEAMAYKLVPIVTPVGSIPEIICSGVNGYLVPLHNYTAIYDYLLELKQNPDKIEEIGKRAYTTILENYSITRQNKIYYKLICYSVELTQMIHFDEIKLKEWCILGTKVSLTNSRQPLEIIKQYDFTEKNYICIFGLLELLQSYTNKDFQDALNHSLFNPLHSRSIELYLKRKGNKNISTVDAVWLFTNLLNENITHFFYGSNINTLQKIKNKIELEFPNAKIAGYKEAPFVNIDEIKNDQSIKSDI